MLGGRAKGNIMVMASDTAEMHETNHTMADVQ